MAGSQAGPKEYDLVASEFHQRSPGWPLLLASPVVTAHFLPPRFSALSRRDLPIPVL